MPTQWYQISGVVFFVLVWLWIEASVDSTENELVVVVVVVVGGPGMEPKCLGTHVRESWAVIAVAFSLSPESDAVKTGSLKSSAEQENLQDESGLFVVLPISAESTVADKSLIKHI
ncbi:hypothetical protein L3X38_026292 [Prunus dulcis]|uniref:Secreted protein n=1 Tax=Prunus dulcis TaxID=3755 RepID=A0AAD4YJP0_PRUDU|nr:hypothetical protein L3X38_026292 [Prunus dulcis]